MGTPEATGVQYVFGVMVITSNTEEAKKHTCTSMPTLSEFPGFRVVSTRKREREICVFLCKRVVLEL